MPRIPFQPRQQSIPGPESIPVPKATPDTFGAGIGRALEQSGKETILFGTTLADELTAKKTKEDADLFVSKSQSEARSKYTRMAVKLRQETDGDITPALQTSFEAYREQVLSNAPNADALRRATVSFDTMGTNLLTRSFVGDEEAREKRILFQSEKSHENNRSSVYENFGTLAVTIVQEENEINLLKISPQKKRELIQKRKFELGYDALSGLIDRDEAGAKQALAILQDPTDKKLKVLMNDPDVTLEQILAKSKKQAMVRYATTSIRAHAAAKRLKTQTEEAQRVIVQRGKRNNLFKLFLDGSLTMGDIKDSGADADTKNFIMNVMLNEDKGDPLPRAEVRAEVYGDLVEMIDSATREDIEDVDRQLRADLEDQFITKSEYNTLSKRLDAPADQSRILFEKMISIRINKTNPMTGVSDPKGAAMWFEAHAEIQDLVEQAIQKDIPAHKLFDPRDKEHYIGPHILLKYKRSFSQIIKDLAGELGNVPSPSAVLEPAGSPASEEDKAIIDEIVDFFKKAVK